MAVWKRKIEYAGYDSAVFTVRRDIRKAVPIDQGELDISMPGLALSTAKCLLTRVHIWTPETTAFARSYMDIIPFLTSDKGGYLAMDRTGEEIVRDFSKTTRHGELAQGLNYLIARNVIGAVSVFDFDYFIRRIRHINARYTGRKPDFILVYPDGSIGILESKGTIEADPSSFMYNGHKQCEDGRSFLTANGVPVRNSYVSAVSFAKAPAARMKRNTKVYYADPKGNNLPSDDIGNRNARFYEYSKLFYLAGNEEAYIRLSRGEKLTPEIIFSSDINDRGRISKWQTVSGMRIELGIAPELREYLCSSVMEFPDQALRERVYSSDNREQFEDGIYIEISD